MKNSENRTFLGLLVAFPILGCIGGAIWMIVEKLDTILIVMTFAVAAALIFLHVLTVKGDLEARIRLGAIFAAASIGPVIGLILNPTIETSELIEPGILKWIAFMLVYLGIGSWLVITGLIGKSEEKARQRQISERVHTPAEKSCQTGEPGSYSNHGNQDAHP